MYFFLNSILQYAATQKENPVNGPRKKNNIVFKTFNFIPITDDIKESPSEYALIV